VKTYPEWLQSNGYDEAQLTEQQRKHLEMAWKAETQPPPPPDKDNRPPEKAKEDSFADRMAAIDAENRRIEAIREAALAAARENLGDAEKCRQVQELAESAMKDDKVSITDFKLSLLRTVRSAGPMVFAPKGPVVTDAVLEAAVCRAGGLESLESHYDEQTLDAAHKKFRGGLGLAGLITICARHAGYSGHDFKSDWFNAVKAAFRGGSDMTPMAAVTGPSTYSLPNILTNTANKFLRAGFDAVDDTWRRISARRSFNDFKQSSTIALTGGLLYKKVGASGELKHGTIGELAYTNQADTYGVMLGIDRKTLINDDLGALTGLSRKVGRGGALALNHTFWTIFLNNSSFFTSGNSNVEATASAMTLTTLGAADRIFRMQTDPDGYPLAANPRILLVPPGSRLLAMSFMNSTNIVATTTANAGIPEANVLAGAYTIESSPYMANSAYTGYSTTASYLLADPDDVPVIEVGFLNGNEMPTVETEAAEFNMLGIALRGYHDFGVSLQEYRGGVRIAGA
jgi:hypothetical protein